MSKFYAMKTYFFRRAILLHQLRSGLIQLLLPLCYLLCLPQLSAIVKYDEGRIQLQGVVLLQDREDPLTYFYLPQFPKLAEKEDGSFELLCIKYVSKDDNADGGIFHALIEFTLPQSTLEALELALADEIPGAKIAGPVPMMQTMNDGEEGLAGFKVVSSILSNADGDTRLTNSIITSGHAPLLPGSRAAIAANLSPEGATLLWESMQGNTSDISVAVSGYYEAAVKGYNAIVTAEMNTVYEHFSRIGNLQEGYTKRELRRISDELVQEQILNIEVFDRSPTLDIETADMEGILNIVTERLIELMFDAEVGWSQRPEYEDPVEEGQVQGRQERGFFSKVFGGARNEKYVSDNQFVIKRREDIRVNKFLLNLTKSTTIKVPVYTTGNLGGLYNRLHSDLQQYFRIINLDDPDFQKREVFFKVDGAFTDAFDDLLNFVSVSFRKTYDKQHEPITDDLIFEKSKLIEGQDLQKIAYPRLGLDNADWLDYEYRISWSLKGKIGTLNAPPYLDGWIKASEPAISLQPPFQKRIIEIDADRSFFEENNYRSASVRFYAILNNTPHLQRTIVLRSGDASNTTKTALYSDPDEPIVYQLVWYSANGEKKEPTKALEDDYLFLIPPE